MLARLAAIVQRPKCHRLRAISGGKGLARGGNRRSRLGVILGGRKAEKDLARIGMDPGSSAYTTTCSVPPRARSFTRLKPWDSG